MPTTKKQKVIYTATAAVTAAAVLLTGTVAWQSISQTALNETAGDVNPGGRLHDDFDGRNKDVYVENFSKAEEGGTAIFARVRLDEYMEIGEGAGLKTGDADYVSKTATSLVEGADINNVATWTTHIPEGAAGDCDKDFHDYWSWTMGGQTVYMPTFNMNKDSLAADINGTYEGTTAGDDVHYDDYTTYAADETKTANEIWDADLNNTDEGDSAVEGINITTKADQTHTAKSTQNATVLTMAQWKNQGSPTGDYWVYDTDGWAYWAEPIMPGEATGLLLNGINMIYGPDGDWYYAINVVGQFTSRGDWGQADNTGFYDPTEGSAPTADAMTLLRKAADLVPEVTAVNIQEGAKVYVKAGEAVTLHPVVRVHNATGDSSETSVSWSISPQSDAFSDGTLTTAAAMSGNAYTVTATSTYDNTQSASTTVYVYPADSQGIIGGANDGKTYVRYDDNTYRELKDDGTLGDYVCAGADEIIGNDDDKPVVIVTPADGTYGGKFLGPNDDGSYYAPGTDGKLGTSDDIKVWSSSTWPNDMTNEDPRNVTVTAAGNAPLVGRGETLQFSASVKFSDAAMSNQRVTWKVSGTSTVAEGTSIDSNGLLTVASNETVGNVLTVRATSEEYSRIYGEMTVTVTALPSGIAAIAGITPCSADTTTIDGIEWYVLAKEGNKALLLSKKSLEQRVFHENTSVHSWKNSSLRTYLNGEWLDSKTTLKQYALTTTLNTIQEYNSEALDTTQDKVFLLSEADVFGTSGSVTVQNSHYTTGSRLTAPNGSWVAYDLDDNVSAWWLRSPRVWTSNAAAVYTDGSINAHNIAVAFPVRPALWVDLES